MRRRSPLNFRNLTGLRFHRLVALARSESVTHPTMWICRCDCGTEIVVRGKSLTSGNTKSCGCLVRDTKPIPFHDLYIAEPTSGCWLWLASVASTGYGQIQRGGKNLAAHRLAWTIHKGAIPAGMHVLHRCDVRCCVNPDHLFLGTSADNSADMKKKGRARGARGEASGGAKLTADQVRAIRADPRSQLEIASDYGVCNTAICKIKQRTHWRHLP